MPRILLLLLALLSAGPLLAAPASPYIPDALKPWRAWVLQDQKTLSCPFLYNAGQTHRCSWPGQLQLEADDKGARFRQQWQSFIDDRVPLPGDSAYWPQAVEVDGKRAVVEEHDGRPWLRLLPGAHTVSGEFHWRAMPDSLQIPADTGLITLKVGATTETSPELDTHGRLWLRRNATATGARPAPRIEIRVFRRIDDTIPARMRVHIELDVSGDPGEVLLGRVFGPRFRPLALHSPLPARLEPDGRLRLQLRPGQWVVDVESRHLGPLQSLTLAKPDGPWAKQEVWSFAAHPALRLVEVKGVAPIDPAQSGVPKAWQQLPAYRMTPGDTLQFELKRRGEPQPPTDRLTLQRTLWLDFDGHGYTARDTLDGQINADGRLEMASPSRLGRVSVNGEERPITRLDDNKKAAGIEVRPGPLKLSADSRLPAGGKIPVSGWNHPLDKATVELNLPPGWRLFAAAGTDRASSTWLEDWTLLDLFLVLIIAVSAYRLWGPAVGLLALVTLALIYPESGAPRGIWLALLAATALQRVLPTPGSKRIAAIARYLILLLLVAITLPFMVQQARQGLYPELEHPWVSLGNGTSLQSYARPPSAELKAKAAAPQKEERNKMLSSLPTPAPKPLQSVEPDARVQTGPGVPDWHWNRVTLHWAGPVAAQQQMQLYLLPPGVNRILAFLRLALVLLLGLALAGVRYRRGHGFSGPGKALGVVGILLMLPLLLAPRPAAAQTQGFPPPELLQELKTRLTAPPECLPQCASVQRMRLDATPQRLHLRLEVHTAQAVAVPLPARADQWLPQQVNVDGAPTTQLFRDRDGLLWVALPPGIHQVALEGRLPAQDSIQIPLPLAPHAVAPTLSGWTLEGLRDEGPSPQLQLRREQKKTGPAPLAPSTLPPFLRVERHLILGLTWEVETRVTRLSPLGSGLVAAIPTLPGESVTTGGITVKAGKVELNLGPNQRTVRWHGTLQPFTSLTLTAPQVDEWTEVWQVSASPIWHLKTSGLAPIGSGERRAGIPEWRPWPGEKLTLQVSRPQAVAGNTLTVDSARLEVHPSQRSTTTQLKTVLRSSRGGQHTLQLPPGATLESISVDGREQPPRQVGRSVVVPLNPGTQTVLLNWRSPQGITSHYKTPTVALGATGANAVIRLQVPRDRWTLFVGGPGAGPAVQFWGVLLVVLLAAVGLSRTGLTPLRLHQWLLLGVGLSQAGVIPALLVVGWLLALGARCRLPAQTGHNLYNSVQLLLALLSFIALLALFYAIQQGLLGYPEMQIAGNGSDSTLLRWYQDRIDGPLSQAWIFTTPLWVYRLLMLAWALWIAAALVRWVKWGWECYSRNGLWRRLTLEELENRHK